MLRVVDCIADCIWFAIPQRPNGSASEIRSTPLEPSESLIADRYPNPRHCSGFEPPLSKRLGCDLIENPIACALLHDRTGNVAAGGINGHETNAAPSDMGPSRLVGVIRYRGAHCHGLCS